MSPRLLVLLAVVPLGLAACGGGDGGSSSSSSKPAEPNTVVMKDIAFQPKDITVKAGTTITWRNDDSVPHDVVNKQDGQGPKSDLFSGGKTYQWKATAPGKISYVCTIHPGMEGTITVTK